MLDPPYLPPASVDAEQHVKSDRELYVHLFVCRGRSQKWAGQGQGVRAPGSSHEGARSFSRVFGHRRAFSTDGDLTCPQLPYNACLRGRIETCL
jgi:hypothetical protein